MDTNNAPVSGGHTKAELPPVQRPYEPLSDEVVKQFLKHLKGDDRRAMKDFLNVLTLPDNDLLDTPRKGDGLTEREMFMIVQYRKLPKNLKRHLMDAFTLLKLDDANLKHALTFVVISDMSEDEVSLLHRAIDFISSAAFDATEKGSQERTDVLAAFWNTLAPAEQDALRDGLKQLGME